MANVGARAVLGGLRSLRVQALQVGMCASGDKADTSKYANTIPLNSTSLFGGCLSTSIANAASFAWDYQAMADGFIQADVQSSPVALERVIRGDLRDLHRLFMARCAGPPAGATGPHPGRGNT